MTFETELEPEDDPGFRARTWIRRKLGEEVPAIKLYDLLTVVTELVTNAAAYGRPGPIRVSVTVEPTGRLSGVVENEGDGSTGLADLRPLEGTGLGRQPGLGLRIVDALVDSWNVSVGESTRVRFALAPD